VSGDQSARARLAALRAEVQAATARVAALEAQLRDAQAQVALWQARALSAEHIAGVHRLTAIDMDRGVRTLLGDDCKRCARCLDAGWKPDPGGAWWDTVPPSRRIMVVCAACGNKRCPHAADHANPCTRSNEPGQPGSAYPAPAPLLIVDDAGRYDNQLRDARVEQVPGGIKVTGWIPADLYGRDDATGYSIQRLPMSTPAEPAEPRCPPAPRELRPQEVRVRRPARPGRPVEGE
jgi:hypothetical protein